MVRASPLPASGFPATAKSQNPFLADLNRVWLTCFHISQEQEERKKRSLFSQQQRTVEDSNMLRSNKDIVCVEPLANYLFSPCTRSESRGCWTESFSAYTLTIYYTVSGKAHLQLWKETPALPTSAAGLAEPVGCRLLICTSESVSLHTRDLRDNEGFVPHVHFLDCTKKPRKLREIALSIFLIDQDVFLNLTVTFFSGYGTGVRFHELDN